MWSWVYSIDYNPCVFTIKQTQEFTDWLAGITDVMTRARLLARLRKLSLGLWGDARPVGEGVSELREHFGPGWRMYCVQRGPVIVVMLGGGSKRTQAADIAAAKALAAQLED
ncbi:type II toxin-antitoxin system RelE/ParE family toxin [Comamonadaceae bacterium OH2310_COT-174]|nr:type II toxin-antitoxin system RelE/ParE family toxin [Comamonadaceae bacterium OH2310_COT-174]